MEGSAANGSTRSRRIARGVAIGILAIAALYVCVVVENAALGPYTTWYNEDLHRRATQADLVGDDESRVIAVLGAPTFTWGRRPTKRWAETGEPTPDARFVTTYNYSPYGRWWSGANFQVHCADGRVASLERYDD